MTGEFSVWLFFPDDTHTAECRFVDPETAVNLAFRRSQSVGAKTGALRMVMITDGGDHCTFLWEHGLGVTFPPHNPTTGHFTTTDDPNGVAIGEYAKQQNQQGE